MFYGTRSRCVITSAAAFAFLIVGGCRTNSSADRSSSTGTNSAQASIDSADYSEGGIERRTEAHARYATALLHDFNEEPESAAQNYLKAALADLGDEGLVLEASTRLLRLKQTDAAYDLLKNATARPAATGAVWARLGLVCAVLNKKDQAIEADRKAIAKAPRWLGGYQQLAQLFLQNKQFDEAIQVIDQAADQPDVDAGFLVDLSESYSILSKAGGGEKARSRALKVLQRAAAQNPTEAILLQKLADGFDFLGESSQAAEFYVKLLEKFPNLPGLRERLIQIYLTKQDRAKATEQLEAFVQANPQNPQAFALLGGVALEEKKPEKAINFFNKALSLNPDFEPVYYELVSAQLQLDKPQDALETLTKARAKFPESFVGEFYTGLAYGHAKDYAASLQHFSAAETIAINRETNRLTHSFYFQLGSAHERLHEFAEAIRYFRKSLALEPDFAEALNYLGYMWAERGENLVEARAMIEKAIKLDPKNAAFLDSLGWVLFKLNKPKEALPPLQEAIQRSEEPDATLFDHLGDIYQALGDQPNARDAWRKSLSTEPNENKAAIQKKLDAASGVSP